MHWVVGGEIIGFIAVFVAPAVHGKFCVGRGAALSPRQKQLDSAGTNRATIGDIGRNACAAHHTGKGKIGFVIAGSGAFDHIDLPDGREGAQQRAELRRRFAFDAADQLSAIGCDHVEWAKTG